MLLRNFKLYLCITIRRKTMKKEEIIDKVGNTLIYFADQMPYLSKTKALKLIYLLDEMSIKRSGIPFFNLSYEAWKFGPVNQEIFTQLDSNETLASLKRYISIDKQQGKGSFIKSISTFNNDEFSDNDITLLQELTTQVQGLNAEQLVEMTHHKGGLWYALVVEKGLLDDFTNGVRNTSDFKIDFHKLVEQDQLKKHLLEEYEEMQRFTTDYSF